MIFDHLSLALNNVKKRGIRSWLTMLGIFIGIAAVVSLISLGNGLQSAITGQFSTLDPDKLVVTNAETGFGPPGSTVVRKLNDDDVRVIERVSGVKLTVSRLVRIATVEYNDVTQFRYITNIPEEREKIDLIYDNLNLEVDSGRVLNPSDRNKVMVGQDVIDDSYGREISVGKTLIINGEEFEVVGLLKRSGSFQINQVIFIPQVDIERILNITDETDLIVVQISDLGEVKRASELISEALRRDRNQDEGEEDFNVQTPEQSLQSINTILSVINIVVGGIAAISLLVGGIGIANTMYTSVLERTKEIGVMKAVGAKNRDVLLIFLSESALLGLVGGVVGAVIGLAMAYLAAFGVNSSFPGLNFSVSLSIPLIVSSILFSLGIGAASGILPALQASKLKPVDALRS